MSGHVSVTTPAGSAVSSQDLYVPFGSFTASQVGYSQRTTLGSSATVSAAGASEIGLLIFDVTAGQRVSLSLSGGTFSFCYLVYLFAPDGTQLAEDTCPAATDFVDSVTAPYTGTYTVGLNFLSNSSGSVSVTPNNASDVTSAITIGGSTVTSTTTVPGQNIALTFSGTAGNAISLLETGSTFSSGANLTVFAPNGTPVSTTATISSSGNPLFVGPLTLPVSGTYKIYIDPPSSTTGQVTTALYNATPVTGTITAGGSAVTFTNSSPGQNGMYTFTGTASERVSLAIQSVSFSSSYFYSPSATVSILKPDGTTLASMTAYNTSVWSPTDFLDVQTLPSAGTYTVMVAPGPYTGTATLTLYNVPADASGTISIGGSAVTMTTTTPGQNAYVTFSGTSGQSVSLAASGITYSNYLTITVYNPDGSVLTVGYVYPSGGTVFSGLSLGQTGTFKIYIDPTMADTGQVTLQLTSP
jgi:Bacterial pre-peptidase C-terminal domain